MDERYSMLESIVGEHIQEIMDLDPILGTIATTNALGWLVDEFILDNIIIDDTEVFINISFTLSSYEHHEDKPYCGDSINGSLVAIIDDNGTLTFTNIEAELNF